MSLQRVLTKEENEEDDTNEIITNEEETKEVIDGDQESKIAFLTGGSGFVGRNLIRYLRKKNWKIRALVRSSRSAQAVTKLGAEPVQGDLNSVEAMTNGMKGADVCFHLAAPVHFWGNVDHYLKITRDGTGNVIKACKDSGIPKLVHLSSIIVMMSKNHPIVMVNETMDYRDDICGVYSICKKEAEVLAVEASKNIDTLSVSILRPPTIWGNDDTTITPKIVKNANWRLFQWFDNGEYEYAHAHVFNVIHALYLLYEKGENGGIYFINDGENKHTMKEFFTDMLNCTGSPLPFMSFNYKCMLCCGICMDGLFCCGQRWVCCQCCEPPVHSALIRGIGTEFTCDDSKIRRELGFEDQITIKEGMLQTADRYNVDRKSVESGILCQPKK